MPTAFVCKLCESDITDFLAEQPIGQMVLKTGVWAVPRGFFMRLDRDLTYVEFCSGLMSRPYSRHAQPLAEPPVMRSGDFLLHEESARVFMQKGAAVGCCGYQPTTEDNVNCEGGHPVGALHSGECWSPLVLRLRADAVLALTA